MGELSLWQSLKERAARWWLLALPALGLAVWLIHWESLSAPPCGFWKRAAFVAAGVVPAQVLISAADVLLGHKFKAPQPKAKVNRVPQRWLGVIENVAYPWILHDLPDSAFMLIIAWITLKAAGSWSGWDSPKGSGVVLRGPDGPRMSSPEDDEHQGRRRRYAFLLKNLLQVLMGAGVAWLLEFVR